MAERRRYDRSKSTLCMEVCKRKARGKIYAEALKSDNTVFVYYLLAHRYQIATGELKEGKSSWVVSISLACAESIDGVFAGSQQLAGILPPSCHLDQRERSQGPRSLYPTRKTPLV